jgi:hypothetical protein
MQRERDLSVCIFKTKKEYISQYLVALKQHKYLNIIYIYLLPKCQVLEIISIIDPVGQSERVCDLVTHAPSPALTFFIIFDIFPELQ